MSTHLTMVTRWPPSSANQDQAIYGWSTKPTYAGYDPAAVRAWAAGRGIAVNARGRIKADVVEKFRAAGN
jgi:hypothetical protein